MSFNTKRNLRNDIKTHKYTNTQTRTKLRLEVWGVITAHGGEDFGRTHNYGMTPLGHELPIEHCGSRFVAPESCQR